MKIAQVNVYFSPFMVGGAEWYVYNISRRLVKKGHEVHVYTCDTYQKQTEPANEIVEGIIVHRIPMKLDLSYRLKAWNGLEEAISREHFDVIHSYDYGQPHTRTAMKIGKKEGIPTVITVFDVHSMIPRSWYKQLVIRILDRYYAGNVLNAATKILVRAPSLVEPLEKIGAPGNKIIVTPSGINEDSLGTFDGKKFLEAHGIKGSPIILFLGRLNPLKGPQHFLNIAPEILKHFSNAEFVLVGPDQANYGETLRLESQKLGVEKNIHFTGPEFEFTKKMEAYSSCDLFVLPTTYEGTSQAIFEAMSQAKPIVATKVGGIPSQIESGKEGLLVPYGDDGALGKAILELLENKELAAKLGHAAREKVKAFTYRVLADELVKIYEGSSTDKISNGSLQLTKRLEKKKRGV